MTSQNDSDVKNESKMNKNYVSWLKKEAIKLTEIKEHKTIIESLAIKYLELLLNYIEFLEEGNL